MLAYVFWHACRTGGGAPGYESALAAFHRALLDAAPPGLLGCAAHAVEGVSWLAGDDVYEDWYLVEGWGDLGVLNQAAVDARRQETHDALARAAGPGAGAVYELRAGTSSIGASEPVLWLDKPRDTPYPAFRERLARLVGERGGAWERQMVLGPAPEYCVVSDGGPASAPVAATVVHRRAVFAGGAVGV